MLKLKLLIKVCGYVFYFNRMNFRQQYIFISSRTRDSKKFATSLNCSTNRILSPLIIVTFSWGQKRSDYLNKCDYFGNWKISSRRYGLSKSFPYSNSHIFVRAKRVWLFEWYYIILWRHTILYYILWRHFWARYFSPFRHRRFWKIWRKYKKRLKFSENV